MVRSSSRRNKCQLPLVGTDRDDLHPARAGSGVRTGRRAIGQRPAPAPSPAAAAAARVPSPARSDMDKLTVISGCLFLAADIFAIASIANPDWISTGDSAGTFLLQLGCVFEAWRRDGEVDRYLLVRVCAWLSKHGYLNDQAHMVSQSGLTLMSRDKHKKSCSHLPGSLFD